MATPFGRYQLLRRVGAGGMAEVYKAVATGPAGFEKVLAIKKVLPGLSEDPAFVEMFVEEAKLAASLMHPNIVQVFDFGQVGGDYYLAMEYVSGCSLGLLLHRLGKSAERLPFECSYFIAVEVARGLGYAHRQQGLVHRDVSPANILISFNGEVKLTDFGIAKAENIASRTQSGLVRGKVAFMSPEQAAASPLDGRSDLFSLGSVIFQCLCGKRLFDSDSEPALFNALATHQRPNESLLAKLPGPARPVVLKALSSQPGERYADGEAMARSFEALLGPGIADSRNALAALVQRFFDPERMADLAEVEATKTRPSAPGDASAALDTHDSGLNRLIPEIAGYQPRVFESRPFRSASGREANLELEVPRPTAVADPAVSGEAPLLPGQSSIPMRWWAVGGGVVALSALVAGGWLWFANRSALHQAELARCGAGWSARVALTRSALDQLDRELATEPALKTSLDSDLALVSSRDLECFEDGAAWQAAERKGPRNRVKPDAEVLGQSADAVVGRLSIQRSGAGLPEILNRIASPGVSVDRLEATAPHGSRSLTVNAQITACRKQGATVGSVASAPPIDPALAAAMKPASAPESCAGLTDFTSDIPSTLENLRQVLAAHDPDARRLAVLKASVARTAPLAAAVRAFHEKRDAHLALFRSNLEELASRAADNGYAALEVDTLGLPRWNSEDEVPVVDEGSPPAAVATVNRPSMTATPARVAAAAVPIATADPNVPGSRFGANPRVDRYDEKFAALDVGHRYLDQWKTVEADREYRKIVKQWDDFPDGHYWYGISGELQGDRARACHEFGRYLELSPYGYYVASARKHSANCH